MINLAEARNFAVEVAKEAGEIARRHYTPNIVFNPKDDDTPVTEADLEINKLVLDRCAEKYPDVGVLGEEGSLHSASDWLWVCDPIDGTIPFALGARHSTFCLALVHNGTPVTGVVYDMLNDRLFSALKGEGAELNGAAIKPADTKPLKLVELEDWPGAISVGSARELFFGNGWQVSNFVSYAFMAVAVATGRIAGAIYSGVYSWDVAAAKVIAEELGCRVTDFDGKDQRYDNVNLNGAITTHPVYSDEIMGLLTKARNENHRH